MDMNKEYKSISHNALIASKEDKINLEFQETLPQYCEDIEQVVRCCSDSVINDYEYMGASMKLYGKSKISIIYITSSKTYARAEFEEPFTKNIDVPGTDSFAFARISECTEFTNFRLINQRKIEVHSSLNVNSSIYENVTHTPLISCSDVILKKESITSLDVIASGITSVDFDEEFVISQNNGSIINIINTSSSVVIEEMRLINDKMLFKCKLELTVLYSDSEGGMEKCAFGVNCSKIIDIMHVSEESKAFAQAKVSSIYVKPVPDADNNMRKLEVAGSLSISYSAANESENELITDAYSIDHTANNQTETMLLNCTPKYISDSKTVNTTVEYNDDDMIEIVNMAINIQNVYIKEAKLMIELMVDVTYYDSQSNIACASIIAEVATTLDDSPCDGMAYANLRSFDYIMKSSNQLDLRLNIEYAACLYSNRSMTYVSETNLEDCEYEESPVLTLYFAFENETIWDIAKKFRTDGSLIMRDNDINSDEIKGRRILLIPGV